jgi:hypothetical protein
LVGGKKLGKRYQCTIAYEDLLTYAETLEADLKKRNLPLSSPPTSLHRKQLHGEDETAHGQEHTFPCPWNGILSLVLICFIAALMRLPE